MKKRVRGVVVVVVFLPFSLKTEKESSFCVVERSSRRFEQKTQRRKTLFFFLKRALIVLKKTDILISNSRLTTNARTDFVKRNFTEKELFKR